jgi:hypothetical protein
MKAVKAKAATPKGKGRGGQSKGKGSTSTPGKGRGSNTPTEETPSPKTKSSTRLGNQKGKTSQKPSTPFQDECSYCGIYGHQSRDCRKRIYAESKKTQRQTNNGGESKSNRNGNTCKPRRYPVKQRGTLPMGRREV